VLQADGVDEEAAAYLRFVREEAARIPHVCASSRRSVATFTAAAVEPIEDASMPEHSWLCSVLDNFVAARSQVQLGAETEKDPTSHGKLPHVTDRRSWHRVLRQDQVQPYSHVLAKMDNNLTASCLKCLVMEALDDDNELLTHIGLWLYGLMIRLEKPLHMDVAATLRQLSAFARQRRASLIADIAKVHSAAEQLAMFDTLLVLAGGFFGQDTHLAPIADSYLVSIAAR
jgi:Survival motor neuron (SMN) interacting protein 1 (SIP1)